MAKNISSLRQKRQTVKLQDGFWWSLITCRKVLLKSPLTWISFWIILPGSSSVSYGQGIFKVWKRLTNRFEHSHLFPEPTQELPSDPRDMVPRVPMVCGLIKDRAKHSLEELRTWGSYWEVVHLSGKNIEFDFFRELQDYGDLPFNII